MLVKERFAAMSTEVEYLRRAFAAAPASEKPRADCPPASRIWEGVRGELAPAAFRQMLHHIAACAVCTEAWRLAEKLEEGCLESGEEGPEEMPVPPSFSRFRRLHAYGGAAAAVVILAVGLSVRDGGTGDPAMRGGDGGAAVSRASSGSEIELLDKGPLPRNNCLLRWQDPRKAQYYKLRVYSVEDPWNPLVKVPRLEVLQYLVPPEALAGLPPNSKLKVHLKAVYPVEGLEGITLDIEVL